MYKAVKISPLPAQISFYLAVCGVPNLLGLPVFLSGCPCFSVRDLGSAEGRWLYPVFGFTLLSPVSRGFFLNCSLSLRTMTVSPFSCGYAFLFCLFTSPARHVFRLLQHPWKIVETSSSGLTSHSSRSGFPRSARRGGSFAPCFRECLF